MTPPTHINYTRGKQFSTNSIRTVYAFFYLLSLHLSFFLYSLPLEEQREGEKDQLLDHENEEKGEEGVKSKRGCCGKKKEDKKPTVGAKQVWAYSKGEAPHIIVGCIAAIANGTIMPLVHNFLLSISIFFQTRS